MKQLNLRLDDDVHAMLVEQADDADRSLNGQVQWLIRQERRRNRRNSRAVGAASIHPDTAPPREDQS